MDVLSLLQRAKKAKLKTGKSIIAQALEYSRLRKGEGNLGPSEYFDYHLYDDNLHSEEAKQEFIGWSREASINDTFNQTEWAVLSYDKIAFYTFLEGSGIPYPRIQAIYDLYGRFVKEAPTIPSSDALIQFLKNDAVYPLFVKPSHGNFGRGAQFLTQFDATSDSILFADGSRSSASEFADNLETKLSGGQIFQNVFQPHPAIAAKCGARSSTMRIVVIATKNGHRLCRALWKVPTGTNIIDNFQQGRTGNCLAAVDIANGQVERVIGQGGAGEFANVTRHPDTNAELYPFTIPDWPKVQDLCLTAARLLPGLGLLHFDIALSDQGPLLLEVNFRGNLNFLQHASGRGFLSAEVKAALQDHAAFEEELAEIVRQTVKTQQSGA